MACSRILPALLILSTHVAAQPHPIATDLATHISRAPASLTSGVQIRRLRDGQIIAAHNEKTPLIPASNQKLLTSWAAAELLGSDFAFETILARSGEDLIVFGAGDPSLGDPRLADAAGVDVGFIFERWAAALLQRHIRSVRHIFVDDSLFEGPAPHPTWPADQRLRWYQAEVGALNFHTNCLDLFTSLQAGQPVVRIRPQNDFTTIDNRLRGTNDARQQDVVDPWRPPDSNLFRVQGTVRRGISAPVSVTVRDPGLFFAHAMKTALHQHGVTTTGDISRAPFRLPAKRMAIPTELETIAIFQTPLQTCLQRTNQQSQNMYAEALFLALSAYRAEATPAATAGTAKLPQAQGTWADSARLLNTLLARYNVAPAELAIADGSGLSRSNRISAAALCAVLTAAWNAPWREQWLETLPTGGQADSTLRSRHALAQGPIAGRVHAKTGYIRGVSALSGYVHAASGEWYSFCILCNNVADLAAARTLQDRIVRSIFERG